MREFEFTITDSAGIHARPAGLLVKKASEFKSEIVISTKDKSANAKKLIMLMSLGIRQGMDITCRIEGEDEEKAFTEMKAFFESNL